MENPFEKNLSVKEELEALCKAYETEPVSHWEKLVWYKILIINTNHKEPLDERILRDLYDHYVDLIKQSQRNYEEEEILKLFLKTPKQGTYKLAEYIVSKYNIITIGEKEREMFIYRDGMYHPGADNLVIFPEIQRILNHHVDRKAKSETYHKICDMTSHPRSVFTETPLRYIPLKNGVFDFETKELLPHSAHYHFMYQFPVIYNPQAECPKAQAFFYQVLTPEQRTIVEEWIGYYFWRNYMFKKAIIFVGAGDTGKTTLLEVIVNLLGANNISSISLQKMSSDKFSAAHLYEKHGNIVDELSARDISDTGAFKMATGGGTITGEYKFGNQFGFKNFSKFTFACNRIPDVSDTNDEAYFNRWMVIRFENVIKKVIPNFIETLKTEEERSGLFNLAMVGLERLLRHKRFSYHNTAEQTKSEMMRAGSSIAMFAAEMLEKDIGNEIGKDTMYDAYVDYCERNHLSAQTKDMLGKRLGDYVYYISDGVSAGGVKRVWRSVKLRLVTPEQIAEEENANNDFNEFGSSETKIEIL